MIVLLPGPTGEFPKGKLTEDDKGELTMTFVRVGDTLQMRFGYPVDWLGFDAEQARALAKKLLEFADGCNA